MNAATPFPCRGSAHIDFSAVVAVAEMAGCHHSGDCMLSAASGPAGCSPWAIRGQHHWELARVRVLPRPVPCRGRQRLWIVPDDVEGAVRAQLGEPMSEMKTWAVVLPRGECNAYELEDDARDVVDLVRQTDSPECELRHFADGQWTVVADDAESAVRAQMEAT